MEKYGTLEISKEYLDKNQLEDCLFVQEKR